jgi:hypothetical protein
MGLLDGVIAWWARCWVAVKRKLTGYNSQRPRRGNAGERNPLLQIVLSMLQQNGGWAVCSASSIRAHGCTGRFLVGTGRI